MTNCTRTSRPAPEAPDCRGSELPAASAALVTPPSDERVNFAPVALRGLSGVSGVSGAAGASGTPKELYFPEPYNRSR
jgi:hypothetical protein